MHLHLKSGPILFIDNFIEKKFQLIFKRNNKNRLFYVMAINLHIWQLICILMNIAYHLSLKTGPGPILFTDVHFIEKDISVVLLFFFNINNQKKWNFSINGH